MTAPIVIHVAGVPRPLPRPRTPKGRTKPVAVMDKKARAWAAKIETACRAAGVLEAEAVACRVDCYMPTDRAERWGRPHTFVPDGDNLLKLALDAAVRAGTLPRGDACVARKVVTKTWARAGGMVMEIRAWRAESGDGDGLPGPPATASDRAPRTP